MMVRGGVVVVGGVRKSGGDGARKCSDGSAGKSGGDGNGARKGELLQVVRSHIA